MSNQIKNGKKPLSARPSAPANPMQIDDIFGNSLVVPQELQEYLTEKGLEWRWVDYKKLIDAGGYHNRGWVAYQKARHGEPATLSTQESILGSDPSGLFRRFSVVLAVRPKVVGDKHRQYLKKRADQYKGFNKTKAQELKEMSKDAGVQVIEGYEENGDNE